MYRFFIAIFILVLYPSIALSGNPAPYTDDALQKIFKAIAEVPMEKPGEDTAREDVHRSTVQYFSDAFARAGYDFNATVDKVIDDLKNNSEAIPRDKQSVYSKVYMLLHLMMYQCRADKVDMLQFFPDSTKESIKWLMENSEFVKHAKNNPHHGLDSFIQQKEKEAKE